MRTSMLPFIERFGHSPAAGRTILSGVSRVHLDQPRTGSFSLVLEHRDKPRPRSVVDFFGEGATGEPLDLKRFDCNRVVIPNKTRARLMEVVGATASSCRMAAPYLKPRLPPTPRAAHFARQGALCPSK